ncbi:hypothetical protein N7450_008462 [Penicillium hetheringtonii]|uniref:Uncharacterized protein n=1 Tax=Penicillium hetheringtonii TaxID=911720 RepID=A0AAD6DCV9_9EURO|nr:hypothetical protein N7450_008462 [Penicillium hetheringtonii]
MLRFFATHGRGLCPLSSGREFFSLRDYSQMRNSEESSTSNPRLTPVLPVRAWCDLQDTPALGIRNIGAPVSSLGVCWWFSLGRVGAEIVCENTLVQYAAYLTPLLFWVSAWLRRGWYHSIPIILVGVVLHFFFPRSVFSSFSPYHLYRCINCALGGAGKNGFFGDSANCGVAGYVLARS